MLCVQLDGALWETIRNISVDTQGEHMYSLRPRINNIQHRIVFDVKLVNNLKIVTIRSAMTIENNTLLPIDVGILDPRGQHFEDNIVKIGKHLYISLPWKTRMLTCGSKAPGESYALPIEKAYHNRFCVRPDGKYIPVVAIDDRILNA